MTPEQIIEAANQLLKTGKYMVHVEKHQDWNFNTLSNQFQFPSSQTVVSLRERTENDSPDSYATVQIITHGGPMWLESDVEVV